MTLYFLFVLGFVFLIKGADWLVEGSQSIAKRLGVSDFVVGLTVVSLGTSLPELLVNLNASLSGNGGLAVGTVVGSNISNILLILGVSAIIHPIAVQRNVLTYQIPFNMLAALLLGFLVSTSFASFDKAMNISRLDGFVLMGFFVLFLLFIVRSSKEELLQEKRSDVQGHFLKSSVMIFVGALGLYWGGKWVVDGAEQMARSLGWSNELLGLSIVAIGTSLPELVTSAVAASKKNADIALANVLGSNIFNILWVLGLSAAIRPIPFKPMVHTDLAVFMASVLLVFLSLLFGGKSRLTRWKGIVFLFIYALYLAFVMVRG